jgi:uncharacterized UPF0146 family protein
MNEDRFTSQNAWYHFILDDIASAVELYGIDVVMTDIYDRIELYKLEQLEQARKGYLNPDLRTYDGTLE